MGGDAGLMGAGAAVLGVIVALAAAACGSSNAPAATPNLATPTLAAIATTRAAATATIEPTLASAPRTPTPTPSPSPAATLSPTIAATTAPTAPPTPKPTPKPTRTLKPGETARPTPINLAPYLTVNFSVANLATDTVLVEVGILDPSTGKVQNAASYTLATFDQVAQKSFKGDYRMSFKHVVAGAKTATCDLTVKDGDDVQFVISDADVAILLVGHEPAKQSELVISTSSLCHRK